MESNLTELAGKEAHEYLDVLARLGHNIALEKLVVDKMGYSPDISGIAGSDYLRNNFIIAYQQQGKSALLNPQYSFLEDLLSKVYEAYALIIEKITPNEALLGQFDIYLKPKDSSVIDLSSYFASSGNGKKKPEQDLPVIEDGLWATVSLDTINHSVRKINEVIKEMKRLNSEPGLILDCNYLNTVLENAAALNKKYGNVEGMRIPDPPNLLIRIESFKFSGRTCEVYVFGDKNPLIIYSGDEHETKPDIFQKIPFVYASDTSRVLDELLKRGYVEFDKEQARKGMIDAEICALMRHGYEVKTTEKDNGKALKVGTIMYYKSLQDKEVKKELQNDQNWCRLREVLFEGGSLESLSLDLKIPFIKQANGDALIAEILHHIARASRD